MAHIVAVQTPRRGIADSRRDRFLCHWVVATAGVATAGVAIDPPVRLGEAIINLRGVASGGAGVRRFS